MQVAPGWLGRVWRPLNVVARQHRNHHQLDHVVGNEAAWADISARTERQIVRIGRDELPLAAAVLVRRLSLPPLAVPPEAVEDVGVGYHGGVSANVVGWERQVGAAGEVDAVVESDAGLVLDNAVHCH